MGHGIDVLKRGLGRVTSRLHHLPIVMLAPHGGCNCRCIMCDIWKNNPRAQRLEERDLKELLPALRRLGTRRVVFTGGEALMHPLLFEFCALLKAQGLKITLLSTGMLLKKNAEPIGRWVDEVILSLDGPQPVHDRIRRVPGAFRKLAEGVRALRGFKPSIPISPRCVIQNENFPFWRDTVSAAVGLGLDHISFLAADVSSEAFNRPGGWEPAQKSQVAVPAERLPLLKEALNEVLDGCRPEMERGFILEKAPKLERIYHYYAALAGRGAFPAVRCNAPWVSAVIEADGSVLPCFFHPSLGNLGREALEPILNGKKAREFRRNLEVESNAICQKCVCSLNLAPLARV